MEIAFQEHSTVPSQIDMPQIRPLQAGDAEAVLDLAQSLRRWFSPRDLQQITSLLRDHPSGLVAEAGDSLVGFLLLAPTGDPAILEIAWMGVAAAWQRHGIGSALLRLLAQDLAGRGVRTLEVSTVAESAGYPPYEATRAFYRRNGFVDLRIDPDYYWPGGDRLILRRSLID
jgi:ribosomal protein S18 acetylase RimI-like enzyme